MQAIKDREEFRLVSNHSYLLLLMEARGRIDDPPTPTALVGSSLVQFPIYLQLLLRECVLNLQEGFTVLRKMHVARAEWVFKANSNKLFATIL